MRAAKLLCVLLFIDRYIDNLYFKSVTVLHRKNEQPGLLANFE